MKNSIIIFTLFVLSVSIHAQSYDGKGDKKLNIGYEIYGENGSGIKSSYDLGLNKMFSLGAGLTYFFDHPENDYFIFARTNMHFGHILDLPCELDIYPGVEIGYLSRNDIGICGYVGLRYFFTEKFGVFAEFGSSGAVGLSLAF